MALSGNLGDEKLFYFTGRVQVFWEERMFFLDEKNAADVSLENFYINGRKACHADLQRLNAKVAESDRNLAPVFNSYVVEYPSPKVPIVCDKLEGKKLWLARYAWLGPIPETVEEQLKRQNVMFNPITRLAATFVDSFDDIIVLKKDCKHIFVKLSDMFVNGWRPDCMDVVKKEMLNIQKTWKNNPHVHTYVVNVDILTTQHYEGPELLIPTLSTDEYGPIEWMAKFAFIGESTDGMSHQVKPFHFIPLKAWNTSSLKELECTFKANAKQFQETSFPSDDDFESEEPCASVSVIPKPILVTTLKKEAGIVKGRLLLANSKFGLMQSDLNVIVFSSENFYVEGEVFRRGTRGLDSNLKYDSGVLNAWIVPLPEPILVFDVYVLWRAVCVWHGETPPIDMEAIKDHYDRGYRQGHIPHNLNTQSDNKYTLLMGKIVGLTDDIGLIKAKVGNREVNVEFKLEAVFITRLKLNSRYTLLEIKTRDLDHVTWSMFAYPVVNKNNKVVSYSALAIWQQSYQRFIFPDLLLMIRKSGQVNNSGSMLKQSKESCKMHEQTVVHPSIKDNGSFQTESSEADTVSSAKSEKKSSIEDNVTKLREESEVKTLSACELRDESYDDMSDDLENPKPVTPRLNLYHGTIGYVKGRSGVIFGKKKYGKISFFVCFDCSNLWIEGKRLRPNQTISDGIVEDKVTCELLAYKVKRFQFCEYWVNMEASAVWIGKRPKAIEIPMYLKKELFYKNIKENSGCEYCNKVSDCEQSNKVSDSQQSNKVSDSQQSNKVSDSQQSNKVSDSQQSNEVSDCEQSNEVSDCEQSNKVSDNVSKEFETEIPDDISMYMDLSKVRNKFGVTKSATRIQNEDFSSQADSNIPLKENENFDVSKSANHIQSEDISGLVDSNVPIAKNESFDVSKTETQMESDGPCDTRPVAGRLVRAWIVFLKAHEGVAMCKCDVMSGEVYIRFSRSNVFVNGVPMDPSFKLTYPISPTCYLYIVPANHVTLGGYITSLEATWGWIGPKPPQFPLLGDQKDARIFFDDVFVVSTMNPKTVHGHIVQFIEDVAIARWRSMAHGGDIFISVTKDVCTEHVQCQFGKDLKNLKEFRPSFFVKPTEHKKYGEYTVSVSATKGWTGKKSKYISGIERKEEPTLYGFNLNVTPYEKKVPPKDPNIIYAILDPNRTAMRPERKIEHLNKKQDKKGIESKEEPTLLGSTLNVTHVEKKIPNKDSAILDPNRTVMRPETKIEHLNKKQDKKGIESKEKPTLLGSTPNVTHVEKKIPNKDSAILDPKKGSSIRAVAQDERKIQHIDKKLDKKGIIIQVHSDEGILQGTDGDQHCFSSEDCYLFGVSLRNVELWHVLAQDVTVNYRLSQSKKRKRVVSKLWVGPENINLLEATDCIEKWCNQNDELDGAWDVMRGQLELLADNIEDTAGQEIL